MDIGIILRSTQDVVCSKVFDRPAVSLGVGSTWTTITGELGPPLPRGVDGEIQVQGPIVCAGYWTKPKETAETFVDGWCRTGDLGRDSENGMLRTTGRIKDRIKDMVRTGGENVYPAEVEAVLTSHPNIADAAVIGVPHPRLHEEICALVVRRDGSALSEDEVVAFAGERLASYKKPRTVIFVEEFPRNASGTISKFKLREQYAAQPTLGPEAATSLRGPGLPRRRPRRHTLPALSVTASDTTKHRK